MYRLTFYMGISKSVHTSEHFYRLLEMALSNTGICFVEIVMERRGNGRSYDELHILCGTETGTLEFITLEVLGSDNNPTVFTPDFTDNLYKLHFLRSFYKYQTKHNKPLIKYKINGERTYNNARP